MHQLKDCLTSTLFILETKVQCYNVFIIRLLFIQAKVKDTIVECEVYCIITGSCMLVLHLFLQKG